MSSYGPTSQNALLLSTLLKYYKETNGLPRMLSIINGSYHISLRVIDWYVTNYAKTNFSTYTLTSGKRFKVYSDYKLRLKSYSKRRFDPFCRMDRITIPYIDGKDIETTIGQLNFFKWAFEHEIIEQIEANYKVIDSDMNARNGTAKRKTKNTDEANKTRKRREELSVSASKSLHRDNVEITVSFS